MINKRQNPLLINIGAGLSCGKSWINFDVSPTLRIQKIPFFGIALRKAVRGPCWSNNVRYGDILKGLPLKEGSCVFVFSSHVFEHLSLDDFDEAAKNVYKYLRHGGVFRIIVPDLEALARKYIKKLDDKNDVTAAAVDFIRCSGLGCSKSRKSLKSRFREALGNSRHQWLWDKYSLTRKLEEHGFRNIKCCKYGEWSDPRVGEIESEDRHQDAICLECLKGDTL
jgi:SAM-dependent methyltransferase